jgi:hypothetical protein
MRRYPELLALKCQKMKGNEPFDFDSFGAIDDFLQSGMIQFCRPSNIFVEGSKGIG